MEYEKVDHPQHYNEHPAGIECITVIEAFNFNLGSVIKYCWRAGLKPGEDTISDLKKAAWYIQREIEQIKKEQNSCPNKETDTVSDQRMSDEVLIKIRSGELIWNDIVKGWMTPTAMRVWLETGELA